MNNIKPRINPRLIVALMLATFSITALFAAGFWVLLHRHDRPESHLERLYESKELIGKSKEEVILLLGDPLGSNFRSDTYEYLIGQTNRSYMPIDNDYLILHFHENQVVSQEIITS